MDTPTGALDGRRAHVEAASELLTRKIAVRCKDGRHVVGDFMCLDPQGNIVLYNAHEYRAGAEGDTTMGGTQVILVPYEQQTDEVTLLGVEQVFLHTPHRLVSTFSVIKSVDAHGASPLKSSKARATPRTVCVTVSRRIGKPGFKATLWVLKRVGSEYQTRKSYRLKHVLALEGSQSVDDHPLCRLTFRVPGAARLAARKDVLVYECATGEVQRELLGVVYSFCRDHEGVVPRLSGLSRADLGVYGEGDESDRSSASGSDVDGGGVIMAPGRWNRQGRQERQGRHGRQGEGVQDGGLRDVGTVAEVAAVAAVAAEAGPNVRADFGPAGPIGHAPNEGISLPVSAPKPRVARRTSTYQKAEAIRADILLDAVSDGATSVEDAWKKISLERQALDDANVHELLELSGVSKRIHGGILRAVSHLDDLEDAFIGFDSKLRRLSKSISVIDESSSYLKHHRSTNAQDNALDALISMTTIDAHMEHVLEAPISSKHFDRIRSAFSKLQSRIGALDMENQDMNKMRAIRDARQKMENIRAQFVFKAIEYFDGELAKAVSDGGQHVYVQLHEKLAMMAPILELLAAADADVAKERVVRYVVLTRELLVREARECLQAIVRSQKDEGKGASVGRQVLKAEVGLIGDVKCGDADERREGLQHIRGGEVSSAFDNMVSTLVPRVANEISVLEDLIDKATLTASIASEYAAAAFVAGIEPLMMECMTSVKSSRGLALLDMTGVVSTSLLKLPGRSAGSSSQSSDPMATLSSMLGRVMEQGLAQWDAFGREIETAIQSRFKEVRRRSASDVRVLPYVTNFEHISSNVESAVADWAARGGARYPSNRSPPSSPTGPGRSTAGTADRIRTMADDLYSRVLPLILRTIEAFSENHEKHKFRIQMENYAFLRTSLQALGAKSSEVLTRHSAEAAELRDTAVRSYVSKLMKESIVLQPLDGSEAVPGGSCDEAFADLGAFETAVRFVSNAARRDLGESSYLIRVVWGCVECRITAALDKCDGGEHAAACRRVLASLSLHAVPARLYP